MVNFAPQLLIRRDIALQLRIAAAARPLPIADAVLATAGRGGRPADPAAETASLAAVRDAMCADSGTILSSVARYQLRRGTDEDAPTAQATIETEAPRAAG